MQISRRNVKIQSNYFRNFTIDYGALLCPNILSIMKKILLFLFISIILSACRKETPALDLFHLTVGTEAGADIAMGLHSAEFTVDGKARWIEVGLVGDIDSYTLSDETPDWLSISDLEVINVTHGFRINVSELNNEETRIGTIDFTATKGQLSQSGTITVTQQPHLDQ